MYPFVVRGSNPGWARFFTPVQTAPGAHPTFCTMGTGSFLGGKVRLGYAADHSPPCNSGPQPGL